MATEYKLSYTASEIDSRLGEIDNLAKKSEVPTKVSELTNDSNFITETYVDNKIATIDTSSPTAKVTQTASGATITVTDKNGTTTATVTNGKDGTDGKDGNDGAPGASGTDGYTPVKGVDYYTDADKAEFEAYIASELAKRGQLKPEFANDISECTDTSKLYVLPDGMIYAWMLTEKEVESGHAYTNLLPSATDTDRKTIYGGDYNGDGVNDGYKTSTRLSSSGGSTSSSQEEMCAAGFIPASVGAVVRIKNSKPVKSVQCYVITYNSSNTKVLYKGLYAEDNGSTWVNTAQAPWQSYDATNNILTVTLSSEHFGTGFDAFRFSGHVDGNTIITVNQEIKEGGDIAIVKEEAWASTGHAFVPADYEDRIIALEEETTQNTADIRALKKGSVDTGGVDALTWIRNWDAPIYDANIPVFLLDTEKAAMTNATNTPDNIYAMYDALMAKHPKYITKTDLGVCTDGVNHVYRYDFVEPEPYHQSNMAWSETKTKAVLVSGIHYEWAGIYSLYYALEEIASNPKLYHLRRNTHFIVLPVLNPYCTITANYNDSIGVLNANGVQIHRNFEVGFIYPGESGYQEFGTRNHGGTEPLSEMETQCLDNIFKENTDAAFFLTCHNYDSPSATNGIGFIWPSTATKYMCNMGYRLIDKMSVEWLNKYADELEAGIAAYRTDNVSDYYLRFGHAHVSSTDGTETRQATKYGIQGANVEVCHTFFPHGTPDNKEPSMSSFTMSRGAETYINFLLTACGCYDHKDKRLYAPDV